MVARALTRSKFQHCILPVRRLPTPSTTGGRRATAPRASAPCSSTPTSPTRRSCTRVRAWLLVPQAHWATGSSGRQRAASLVGASPPQRRLPCTRPTWPASQRPSGRRSAHPAAHPATRSGHAPPAVTHAGLEGHGNYFVESPLVVYAQKNATFKGERTRPTAWLASPSPQPASLHSPGPGPARPARPQAHRWTTWAACGSGTAPCATPTTPLCPPPTTSSGCCRGGAGGAEAGQAVRRAPRRARLSPAPAAVRCPASARCSHAANATIHPSLPGPAGT